MGRNILVVEDDRNISDLIQMYLVKEGFDVRIAGDGGKAIDFAGHYAAGRGWLDGHSENPGDQQGADHHVDCQE